MISALILAAGQSRRMGQPKMPLQWGESTVLEHVIVTFQNAGADEILVVIGAARDQVEALVGGSAETIFNPEHAAGEMLSSVQVGLGGLNSRAEAALIALGDQPQVQESSVRQVIESFQQSGASLVVPSFQMRRGHPWLVAQEHWDEIQHMRSPETLRDFLNQHANEIRYVVTDNESVLHDIDTPEDYQHFKP